MKENPTLRQQNLAALALAVISLLGCVMILFLPPRPTMGDTGLYSLVLPQLGLTQGSTQGVFAGTGIPWGSLLQWTSGPSLAYPAALAQLLAFGGEVSLTLLAGILAVLYAIALFFLCKALCARFGGWGMLASSLWALAGICGNYVLYFASLYAWGWLLVTATAFAAGAFRGMALLRQGVGGKTVWLPLWITGLLLLTASELCVVLLLPVLGLFFRQALSAEKVRRGKALAVLAAAVLTLCAGRFALENGQIFNQTNLYHSFFDGLLTLSPDPEQTLRDFELDENLLQDVGKSAYLPEEDYYISPNADRAAEIFDHLSYGRITAYYLRHPGLLTAMAGKLLETGGHVDVGLCVCTEGTPVPRGDYWDLLRSFLFSGTGKFLAVSVLCALVGLGACLKKKTAWGLPGLLLPLCGGLWLLAAILGCGLAEGERNRIGFQLLFDGQLVYLLTLSGLAVTGLFRMVVYSPLSARTTPEPVFPAEGYVPFRVPAWTVKAKAKLSAIWEDPRAFSRWMAFLCLTVMVLVLYVPRFGAYNNGDFGRMMDAMGLVHTPENYFHPETQYQKVIEGYDYLEPYDWTRIRPGKMELTQSWLSALMRVLYDLAGVPFSTAILALFHLLTLSLCVYALLTALYRQWGKGAATVGGIGYLLFFCGSYNLGWLNSLYGEGIAFVGLMLVLASSAKTIQAQTASERRWGLVLLGFSCVYLACAKAQYAVLAPVLLLWWAVLAISTAEGVKKKLISAGAAVLVAALLGSYALGVYGNNESISSQDTLYSGLMNGILLYADDPEEALEDLGLDPGLIADKGKHPYLPKEDYYCPPRTEKAEELLYSKVSSTKYLAWYLKHPKAFWHLLDDTASYAADPMPDFNLYIGETNVGSHRTVNKWNLWAQMRPNLLPRRFAGYLLLFGLPAIAALMTIFRKGADRRRKLYAGLLLVLLAIGAMQYPLPMVGNGRSDPIKQLYLFREVTDFTYLFLLTWASARMTRRK